jgi:plastocyanin
VRAKDSAENIGATGSLAFTIDNEDTNIVQISIQDFVFTPATVTISVGTTVKWTNLDSAAHTATSDNAVFGSVLLSRNATYSFTFAQAGQFDYHCTPHPFMTATIIVE